MRFKNKKSGMVSLGWIIVVLAMISSIIPSQEEETSSAAAEATYAVSLSTESMAQAKASAAAESLEQAAAEEESREQQESLEAAVAAEQQAEAEKKAAEQAEEVASQKEAAQSATPDVPAGELYAVVNNNVPYFTDLDLSLANGPWEAYGPLDALGRVTAANAMLSVELMPAEERGSISEVYPTGWQQEQYAVVSGGWLYNRSHLIGFQLTGENANGENLMTGTRYFNTEGMLPFENFVANYIETTENHVRYRVTPHFEGDNLLASGVFMEGFSIEDNGEGMLFNIYVPNVQPGVVLDYATGASWPEVAEVVEEPVVEEPAVEQPIVETAPPAPTPTPPPAAPPVETEVYYQNCTAVREAGAAPIYAGQPGWHTKFDRDGDGVGCEP